MPFDGKNIALWCLFLLPVQFLFAQAEEEETLMEESIMEQIVEEMEESEEPFDISEFTERLRHYLRRPIDLNRADERELSALLFLSPLQIANLLRHREATGAFISKLELQAIDGFDRSTIERLLPFVTVGTESALRELSPGRIWTDADRQLMFRYGRILERQRGYETSDNARRYLGDANRYTVRYRSNFRDAVRLAVNMEKDAGEPFFSEKQRYGFDHYGVSLHVRNAGRLKDVVLGDFALQSGQGLVVWNGLGFGKGAMVAGSARQGVGLRSYTSMNEGNFLRGAAVRVGLGGAELTPFVSYRKLSGSLEASDNGNVIGTISTTGLHRTPIEQQNRRTIGQKVLGMEARYGIGRLHLGLIGLHTAFNGEITPEDQLRNRYAFRGSGTTHLGLNYRYTFRNIYLYGESAYQWERGWATNNGLIGSLHPQLSLFANYRNYQRDYHSFFARAMAEGSGVSNERAVYGGLVYHPDRRIEWVNYVDIFRFPWLRFRTDAPSSGTDFLSQFTYSWYKKGKVSLRYRHRLREENAVRTAPENHLAEVLKDQLRLDFRYKLSGMWELRTRLEGVRHEKENAPEYGGLVYSDVFWTPNLRALRGNVRFAVFRTDSYNARLYAYESDVLYANSFPLYNGKGVRTYLNVHFRSTKRTDMWMRYALTRYAGVESVGSGLETSEGQVRSDIKIQMRCRF